MTKRSSEFYANCYVWWAPRWLALQSNILRTRGIQVRRQTQLWDTQIVFCHFWHILLQLKCTWSSISPKLWFRSNRCRRTVVLGLSAGHLPCNTNTNGEYGGWRSSSKPAFWMAASAWADVWSGMLSWLQVLFFLNWKNSWKDTKFLTMRTLSARQMAGWKTKNNNSSTTEWELWRNPGPSAFQLQENMSKSDKICASAVSVYEISERPSYVSG